MQHRVPRTSFTRSYWMGERDGEKDGHGHVGTLHHHVLHNKLFYNRPSHTVGSCANTGDPEIKALLSFVPEMTDVLIQIPVLEESIRYTVLVYSF